MKALPRAVVAASAAAALGLIVLEAQRGRHWPAPANTAPARAVASPAFRPGTPEGPKPAAQSSPLPEPTLYQIARMKEPGSRQQLIEQAKIRIATSRAPLLRMLQPISPDMLDRISDILAAAELDTRTAMLELHAASPSPSGEQVEAVLAAQTAVRDANARAALDDTQYAQYTSYWESEPFTQTIDKIADVMRAQGSNISPDLQQQMLTAYAAAQKWTQQAGSTQTGSAGDVASAADQYLAGTMSRILSPDDFKAFMSAQNKIDFSN
jgi:hypothetical protein